MSRGYGKRPEKGEKKMDLEEFANKVKGNKTLEEFAKAVEKAEKALDEERCEKGYCVYTCFVTFTDSEIDSMPLSFSMKFAQRGENAHAYAKKYIKDNADGLMASVLYEIFYRVNGDWVSVTADTVAKAKRKFICALWLEEAKKHK